MLSVTSHPNSDMSPQPEVFNIAVEYFSDEQEEVRTAAAFAAGTLTTLVISLVCRAN